MLPQKNSIYLVFTLFIIFGGCSNISSEQGASSKSTNEKKNVLILNDETLRIGQFNTKKLIKRSLNPRYHFQGELKVPNNAQHIITARISGLITKVYVHIGDQIKKGSPLISLKSRELAKIYLDYTEGQRRIKVCQNTLKREKNLLEKGLSTQNAVRKESERLAEATLSYATAKAKLNALGVSIGKQKTLSATRNGRLTFFAPIDGTVVSVNAIQGQATNEESSLLKLSNLSKLIIHFQASTKQLALLKIGQEVEVKAIASDQHAKATLSLIHPLVDTKTRSVALHATLDNRDFKWRAGMSVKVVVHTEGKVVLAIPKKALTEINGKTFLFIKESKNQFIAKQVVAGQEDSLYIEIKEGVKINDEIVVNDVLSLKSAWLNREE